MNPVERIVRHVDAWQQRHRVPAFGFAVFKKFGDDQAGNQVALLTYFAFLATFPLLLALVGILGIVLKNDPGLQQRIVSSSFGQFPIIGTQLHSQLGTSALPHSGIALIIGLAGAILGGRGLASASPNAGSADAAASSWTAPSSGTRPICGGSCTSTKPTTISTALTDP